MPEIKRKIHIWDLEEIVYKCNRCNIGFMKSTGIALTVNPPKYQHKCTFCSNIENLDFIYPKTNVVTK